MALDQDTLGQIAQGLERILADAPLEAVDHASGQGAEADAVWAVLSQNGFPAIAAGEAHGGFGGSIADAALLAQLTARHALALPLADTMLVMNVLSQAGLDLPQLKLALADPVEPGAHLAHAIQAQAVLTLAHGQLQLVPISPEILTVQERMEDGAAALSGPLPAPSIEGPAPNWLTPIGLRALGALIRSAQMAGAMQAVLDLTLSYTQEREQFGRPLAKFQAIQHHLSDIACETAASIAAVELACDAIQAHPECPEEGIEEIAIAKIRCGQAAAQVAACAHQAHGAMGFTREYKLGRYTRRLWQWQDEFGSESEWSVWLGSRVLADDQPALWPRISRSV